MRPSAVQQRIKPNIYTRTAGRAFGREQQGIGSNAAKLPGGPHERDQLSACRYASSPPPLSPTCSGSAPADTGTAFQLLVPHGMSARQLNRLAKAKGLDPLLGGSLNVDSDESDAPEDSEEEGAKIASGMVVSASVTRLVLCGCLCMPSLGYMPSKFVCFEELKYIGCIHESVLVKVETAVDGNSWRLY